MGLNFPNTPATGERFTAEGRTFVWNGSVWLMEAENIPWASLEEALAAVATDRFMSPAAMAALIDRRDNDGVDFGALQVIAWGLFNGSTGALIAGRNFEPAVLVGTGSYRFIFTTPPPDDNYLVHCSSPFNTSGAAPLACGFNSAQPLPVAGQFDITTGGTGGSNSTSAVFRGPQIQVAVFR
jgi:hypothetical protein